MVCFERSFPFSPCEFFFTTWFLIWTIPPSPSDSSPPKRPQQPGFADWDEPSFPIGLFPLRSFWLCFNLIQAFHKFPFFPPSPCLRHRAPPRLRVFPPPPMGGSAFPGIFKRVPFFPSLFLCVGVLLHLPSSAHLEPNRFVWAWFFRSPF